MHEQLLWAGEDRRDKSWNVVIILLFWYIYVCYICTCLSDMKLTSVQMTTTLLSTWQENCCWMWMTLRNVRQITGGDSVKRSVTGSELTLQWLPSSSRLVIQAAPILSLHKPVKIQFHSTCTVTSDSSQTRCDQSTWVSSAVMWHCLAHDGPLMSLSLTAIPSMPQANM